MSTLKKKKTDSERRKLIVFVLGTACLTVEFLFVNWVFARGVYFNILSIFVISE